MKLLLDFGNSRLKWGWSDDRRIVSTGAIGYVEASEHNLAQVFGAAVPESIWAVSVTAAEQRERVSAWLRRRWGRELRQLAPEAQRYGIVNGYRQPERLGADRWAVLIAARAATTQPVCVIDCGSAVTVDTLDAEGRHQGGVILPGLGLMRRALAQGTSALPLIDDAPITGAARDTASAIASGTLLGLAAAVDGLARDAADRLGVMPRLFITGGDAPALVPRLQLTYEQRPHLVLEGLAVAAEHEA